MSKITFSFPWEENTCQLKNLQGSTQTTVNHACWVSKISSQSRAPALPGRAQAFQTESFRVWMSSEKCGHATLEEPAQRRSQTQTATAMATKRPEQAKSTAAEGRRVGLKVGRPVLTEMACSFSDKNALKITYAA